VTELHRPTENILDQVVESTRDHQSILADLATRTQPYANELIAAWTNAYREATARQPLAVAENAIGIPELVQVFFSELQRGNVRQSLANLSAWIRYLTQFGLSYDVALQLVREYQRGTLPSLMRVYSTSPELPLALDALDELFDSAAILISSAYMEALQERVADGAALRMLGQLARGAAHSLNNLLAAILGQARLLSERTRDDELRDELQEIQQEAVTGAQIVRRLQEFARVEPHARFVEADVNFMLRQISEVTRFLWRDQAEANGVVIDVVKDFADVPPVRAQSSQLRWALTELLLNAIEALPRGGLITLRTERQGDRVLVSVVDNGEGMTESTRTHACEPFFTTKESPHVGLGLATAAKIVAAHDGALTIESMPGRGAMFTLTLPIAQRTTEEQDRASQTAEPANILIIDNEPSVRDIFTRLLTSIGHRVVAAEDGSQGLARFRAGKFDLVFTDLGMPGMSGWDVAHAIKELNPKMPVVLMTGWQISLDPQKAKETGVDRLVNKPFDVPQLLALIDEMLGK